MAEQDPDSWTRAGGWLFKRRTIIPLPIALALLLIPTGWTPLFLVTSTPVFGLLLVGVGELLRLWGVHHIGAISRTRSDRLGPLVDTGPFAIVRNPLYLGNILIWLGFTISARLAGLAPLVALVLALEYHAIVRWEERLLESRLGEPYRKYVARVPRWLPRSLPATLPGAPPFSWRTTFFSERGTLIAIAVGYLLLGVKGRL